MNRSYYTPALALAALTVALTATGCGSQGYMVTSTTQLQQAPGGFTVPAKVDIILVEDDTGSIREAYSSISEQFPTFLKSLDSKGWDYHFATIPLTTHRPINQIVGSMYDSGWGSAWIKPFPIAMAGMPGTIGAGYFSKPTDYQGFLAGNYANNSLGGSEPGLETIRLALNEEKKNSPVSGFLRDDAITAVVVLGNGNDTSKVNICTRSDGYSEYCTDGSYNSSLDYYQTEFSKLKTNPSMLKFYAMVAGTASANCLGGTSRIGTRYQDMATRLGGKSYDVCSQSLNQILTSLTEQLSSVRYNFRTRYLFVASEPNLAKELHVYRYKDGDPAQKSEIKANDPINGWTYAGNVSNVYAVDAPFPMNPASGFAFELHGSAKLSGNDTAEVSFHPAGAEDSISK